MKERLVIPDLGGNSWQCLVRDSDSNSEKLENRCLRQSVCTNISSIAEEIVVYEACF